MQISKLVTLIVKIFLCSAIVSFAVFFIAVYIDSTLISLVLPSNIQVSPAFAGAINYAMYSSIELSVFFTTFTLVIIRLSIFSGTILTIRDIIGYYKKFIITTFIVLAVMACALALIFSNLYSTLKAISNGLPGSNIITYALPCFWLILAAIYYKGYQSKINETDGCKDRSWLEGNIES